MEVSMSKLLPTRPNLEHLKTQARDLLTAVKNGQELDRIQASFPNRNYLTLVEAQLVIAREYGFDSWPKLKAHIESISQGGTRQQQADDLAKQLVQGTPAVAKSLALADPSLLSVSLACACATGSRQAVSDFLDLDPTLVESKVGPNNWEPLLYVCNSRLLQVAEFSDRLVQTAKLILEAGANPNVFWEDQYRLSALYGAAGLNGNADLTELLLQAGANPNDDESVYHSTELDEPDCLGLLLQYGGNVEDAMYRLLDFEKPEWIELVLALTPDRSKIPPCIPHGLRRGRSTETFRILTESGMDLSRPDSRGKTPYQAAVRLGRLDVIEMLKAKGAVADLSEVDTLLKKVLLGESIVPEEITPELLKALDEEPEPAVVMWSERGYLGALETLLKLGANPNVADHNGFTGLHQAALAPSVEVARLLLQYGADVTQEDYVHHGTPLGFASHVSANTSHPQGYVDVVEEFLKAGCPLPNSHNACPEVLAVLKANGFVDKGRN